MPQFKLCWTELYDFEALVEAENLEEAIMKFKEGEVNFPSVTEATYVDDSSELNVDFINEINDPITGVKDAFK